MGTAGYCHSNKLSLILESAGLPVEFVFSSTLAYNSVGSINLQKYPKRFTVLSVAFTRSGTESNLPI